MREAFMMMDRREVAIGAAAVATWAMTGLPASAGDNPFKRNPWGARSYMLECNSTRFEPEYAKGSFFFIDPDRAPKDGDLIHVKCNLDGADGWSFVTRYTPHTGKDCNSRFVKRGSQEEVVNDCFAFTRGHLDRGDVTLLGTVVGVYAVL
jgi:hypothetical protein